MRSLICSPAKVSFLRAFHSSSGIHVQTQKQRLPSCELQPKASGQKSQKADVRPESTVSYAKRNEVGVQLLSSSLHSQIFKNVSFPAPDSTYVQISRDHLAKHNLDPATSSTHPDISFTLPPLQGSTIDSHFYTIGAKVAEPFLSLAKEFASTTLPPRPESWVIQPGWTKYWAGEDGLYESVEHPTEEMLVFDIESMPNHHQFAVMACAVSRTAWYTWISPWLLEQTSDPEHLIPIGNPTRSRIVVGHNISYDRARTQEEYHLVRTGSRWLDTMALHVAVNGISSHQRPAWSRYRKKRHEGRVMKDEAVESVLELIDVLKKQIREESDKERREELEQRLHNMQMSLPSLQAIQEVGDEREDEGESQTRWEDLTSANSLADVAHLHCGIEVDKSVRDGFMTASPGEILANISTYLNYCATDVEVTHAVFCKTLPAFLNKCPNPVSFAGMCSMGNSFLTVDESWERYTANAEGKYRELEKKVGDALRNLAEEARQLHAGNRWKDDIWLEQLDWTPKKARIRRRAAVKSQALFPHQPEPDPPKLPPPEVFNTRPGAKNRLVPKWFNDFTVLGPADPYVMRHVLPFLLRLQINGQPVRFTPTYGWHTLKDSGLSDAPYSDRVITPYKKKTLDLFDRVQGLSLMKRRSLGRSQNQSMKIYLAVMAGVENDDSVKAHFTRIARRLDRYYRAGMTDTERELWWPWMEQLDWTPVPSNSTENLGGEVQGVAGKKNSPEMSEQELRSQLPELPQWYWQLCKPTNTDPYNVDITVRSRVAPILLRLKWLGWPLVFSREHGWTFRVTKEALKNGKFTTRQRELSFYHDADEKLRDLSGEDGEFVFFKLPHKDGDDANVGSPLGKTFLKFAADGTLSSPGETAKDALDMNAQCSYWISARDRIMKQMVVWDRQNQQGFPSGGKWGMILPQVITMGTVTRRAIEKTWLTASNAKSNRIGSELKAMVRAPPGYAIVGADVDSEELWISSCMGDAQFGLHGATAIGWMTLEGTKKAGTDLHSKTASILGISRDQAKVFNYSRIYGAGMKHAMLLLLQGNAGMLPDQAQKLAENLYASTKGKNTHRPDLFERKFWFGGTESFLFNKLEEIALSDQPRTPALGCGVTYALSKQYLPEKFGADYLPSRINWVVQSSGVDYLHLLIVAMEHLTQKYNIQARYLISVHDELRYLVKEEDQYRAALALQIANLWTRSLFAYRLGMDDLPQGVAFFSAVDVDKVLRKEVDMPCVTPSQPVPIPPGESLDISKVLQKTNGGSLWADGRPMDMHPSTSEEQAPEDYVPPDCMLHRAKHATWLRAQATDLFEEVKFLAGKEAGKEFFGGIGMKSKVGRPRKKAVAVEDVDVLPKRPRGRPRKLANVSSVETWDGVEAV